MGSDRHPSGRNLGLIAQRNLSETAKFLSFRAKETTSALALAYEAVQWADLGSARWWRMGYAASVARRYPPYPRPASHRCRLQVFSFWAR